MINDVWYINYLLTGAKTVYPRINFENTAGCEIPKCQMVHFPANYLSWSPPTLHHIPPKKWVKIMFLEFHEKTTSPLFVESFQPSCEAHEILKKILMARGWFHGIRPKGGQRLLRIEGIPCCFKKCAGRLFRTNLGFCCFGNFQLPNKKTLNFGCCFFFERKKIRCAKSQPVIMTHDLQKHHLEAWRDSKHRCPGWMSSPGPFIGPFLGTKLHWSISWGGDELSILLPMKNWKNWKDEKFRSVLT